MATRERTLEEELARFADRWKGYAHTEMAGAQSFLRELQECYGIWDHAPGTVFEQHPVKPAEEVNGELFGSPVKTGRGRPKTGVDAARMDMYIPKVVVWEMKGPDERDLQRHHPQLLSYWARTRPRYMVLCNFHTFWIYDTDREGGQMTPALRFTLEELPDNASALFFLKGEEAYFAQRSANVTREAAEYVGEALRELLRTSDNPKANRQRFTKFTLECVFAMFAEDAKILPGKPFTAAMKAAQASGDLSPVYNLFDDLGREEEVDRSHPVPYVNGPLFDRQHPKFPVAKSILSTLYTAAEGYDWQAVRPEVFGSIFERALLSEERAAAGAHFTSEADIMKVVGPTVVRPWQERIATCKFRKDADRLIEQMCSYHILDPACGSGNFLYVAFREMKRLEAALRTKHYDLWNHKERKRASEKYPEPPKGPWFGIHQLHGIDKLVEAVQLTRVVLWIGNLLANIELNLCETTLPLKGLEANIVEGDALFMNWPRPDGELAIVGNPPFMGRSRMRAALGDEYINSLHERFPHNRNADLVTYWYPKALEVLRPGERAGFVSSNSIAQNESREASLDRIIAAGGTLHDCWKSYPWPGEAAVHVSIVNWVMSKHGGLCMLDGMPTDVITPQLTNTVSLAKVARIEANRGLAFEGVKPGNNEFVIDEDTRTALIKAHALSAQVIKPFITGRDINQTIDQTPTRWVIDFNQMSEAQARQFTSAFRFVQEHVYPARTSEFDRKLAREKEIWWQFERPRPDMRLALKELVRYLAVPITTPHVIVVVLESGILPSNLLEAIALDSYYHFGILQSVIHETWAWARGSTLEERLRYTNTTIFETFPFPLIPAQPKKGKRPAVAEHYDPREVPDNWVARSLAETAEKLYAARQEACLSLGLGLTKLYNLIKNKRAKADPQDADFDVISSLSELDSLRIQHLRVLHEKLNILVCMCYGWEAETWEDENEVLKRLLELNQRLSV